MKPRTSKTVNGVTTTYYLDGSRIIGEETNGNLTVYIYDASGSPIGMQYHGSYYDKNTWDVYWFEKNLQGDIVAVYNNSGIPLVSYEYDAWGNHTVSYRYGSSVTAAANNPFRYRGYYYDADLDLYYLNSRYYDSYTGRFLNADSSLYHSMLGYNMFAYCNNNPVSFYDPTGDFAISIGALAGALAVLIKAAVAAAAATVAIGAAVEIGKTIGNAVADAQEAADEPKQSITEPEDSPELDTEEKDKNKLPTTDEPNTDKNLYDDDGLKQTRHYGPDGKAEYDIDYHHPGNKHKFPHKHKWTWKDNIPSRSEPIDIF